MIIEINDNVRKVVEFMQREIPADELRGVAEAIPVVGAAIWSQYPRNEIHPMRLSAPPIITEQTQSERSVSSE